MIDPIMKILQFIRLFHFKPYQPINSLTKSNGNLKSLLSQKEEKGPNFQRRNGKATLGFGNEENIVMKEKKKRKIVKLRKRPVKIKVKLRVFVDKRKVILIIIIIIIIIFK